MTDPESRIAALEERIAALEGFIVGFVGEILDQTSASPERDKCALQMTELFARARP